MLTGFRAKLVWSWIPGRTSADRTEHGARKEAQRETQHGEERLWNEHDRRCFVSFVCHARARACKETDAECADETGSSERGGQREHGAGEWKVQAHQSGS
jgi:hypothetical protein